MPHYRSPHHYHRPGPPPPPPGPKWDGPRFLRPNAAPPESESWSQPWVQLRTYSYHPTLYPAMLNATSPDAKAGDVVTVYDKDGRRFGAGFYNPKARVPLRMIYHGSDAITEEQHFPALLERAVDFRKNLLKLDPQTEAYRVINSDGDGLSGLIVDRFGDVLSAQVHSLGVYQRLQPWMALLHERLGTKRELITVDDQVARFEGIEVRRSPQPPPDSARIRENGVRYEVDFTQGHKTGFFCDQRENRRRLARLVKDRRVLDLCCYTGGFAITAATLGEAADVTGVDLDETAVEQARRNGNLNQQTRIHWIHADAFAWARQMQQNGEKWDVIVLDPPKFVTNREEEAEGRQKYEDLNTLAMTILASGGLLITCSCSGAVPLEEFERIVIRAAHRQGRRLQFFDRTSAGPDHPVMSNCPESRYLKVLWGRAA